MEAAIQRVILFAEAVTLAHVARLLRLGEALLPIGVKATLAVAPHYDSLIGTSPIDRVALASITPGEFGRALARGAPVFSPKVLEGYVEQDLALMDELRPDVVVGDFRLSLRISASLRRIPYVNVTNAYWSLYARPAFQVPSLPITQLLGPRVATPVFRSVFPLAMRYHALPIVRAARRYGLHLPLTDVRAYYTAGDRVLYADARQLVPLFSAPASHEFIGPVLWSPPVALPDWWHRLPADRPIAYVTLGSSGAHQVLNPVVKAVVECGMTAVVARAGATAELPMEGEWVFTADYLPGEAAARRAAIVVCNGGSPTSYQALAAGVPVLSIPSNLDQYLNASYFASAAVGLTMRSDALSIGGIRNALTALLSDPGFGRRARALAFELSAYDAGAAFARVIQEFA